jgi:hypothetical protein
MARFLKFGLKESTYQRPTQKWICGNLSEGDACPVGPNSKGCCMATTACMPVKKKDRWFCTRADLSGGECDSGPLPSGECCQKISACTPVLNTRHKRGQFVLFMSTLGIAFLLLMLFGPLKEDVLSSGVLSEVHQGMNSNCLACHSAAEKGVISNIVSLHSGFNDNEKCLRCHNFGKAPANPHSLASLKSTEGPQVCSNCHKEHKGAIVSLKNSESCQDCHDNYLQKNHRDFASNFPFKRRTRMIFDHKAHFSKYFKEKKGFAPEKCSSCHTLSPTGKTMLVKSFSLSCSACHENQIVREDKKYNFFSVPLIDTVELENVGEWPEDAEGEITPFMKLILAQDPSFVTAYAGVKDLDWGDLTEASPEKKKQVQVIVWKIKELLHKVTNDNKFIKSQLAILLKGSGTQKEIAMFDIPRSVLKRSTTAWFPALRSEMKIYRTGDLSKLKSLTPEVIVPEPVEKKKESGGDDDEIDIGDDDDEIDIGDDDDEIDIGDDDDEIDIGGDDDEIDLGGDDDEIDLGGDDDEIDLGGDEEDEDEGKDADVNVELIKQGQWEMEDFSITYTPESHADKILKYWLEHSVNNNSIEMGEIFSSLKDPDKSPGSCLKCHSVDDTSNKRQINWQSKRPKFSQKNFTKFNHSSHSETVVKEGCIVCHVIDRDTSYMSMFKGSTDPLKFHSSFRNIKKDTCLKCHSNNNAGNKSSCIQCHNYHIGSFEKTLHSSSVEDLLKSGKKIKE